MSTTPMIAPDGSTGDVPQANAQAALKAGFKPAVDMIAPDGSKGIIPQEKMQDAIKAGFKGVDPMTTAALSVAKPQTNVNDPNSGISDNSYSLAGTLYGATQPKEVPPHPDFKAKFNPQTMEMDYQYPAGQKPLFPAHSITQAQHPELSTDDAGNFYLYGNKQEVMGTPVTPVGPLTTGAKVGAEAVKDFLASETGKKVAKFALEHAAKGAATAAGGGIIYKLGKALGWL